MRRMAKRVTAESAAPLVDDLKKVAQVLDAD
jgi:hypothetical protein